MDIKDRLKEIRDYAKMGQTNFEKHTGISSGYFNKVKGSIGSDTILKIADKYPEINLDWLITGKGEMLKSEETTSPANLTVSETRPRIPYAASAGSLTSSVNGVTAIQCEQIPVITAFPAYDFTIIIKGNSMYPYYEGGDEVACKRVDNTSFIQWGKVHVMDTAQGIVIKRVYEDGEGIRCVSYNKEYPDFTIAKNEIYSMSLVVGLLRM